MYISDNSEENISPINTYTGVRWLKLIPAAKYSSLGQHRLKELAKRGIIIGFPDPDNKRNDWIFDKESIDKYRLRQAPASIEEKLLALTAKVRL